MLPGERLKNWIDGLAESWKDRLRGWMASWVDRGIFSSLSGITPEMEEILTPVFQSIKDDPDAPKVLKDIANHALSPLPIWLKPLMYIIGALFAVQQLTSMVRPADKLVEYLEDRKLKSSRLDPLSVITLQRRFPGIYKWLDFDSMDLGVSPERKKALEDLTLFYPSPRDLIGFMAHEVFEDPLAERYGLDAEIGDVLKHKDAFEKAGVTETQIRQYWRDHWKHASWMQIVEMLHRGALTEGDVSPPTTKEGWVARDAEGFKLMYDWFKLVEMSTFWREKLEATSWNVPTRVDVRRWWDMRTISEQELYNIYHRQGYHGTDLDNYVKWTKVYTDFPMMMSRFTNGWITEEDIRVWLRSLQIPEERITQFIQEKTKPEAPARVAKERDLTAAEIMKGIKKGVITAGEGVELLQDMGYSEDEAWYKIEIDKAVAAGSPETFAEFKDLTQRYKIAIGREAKPMPEEIKIAAAQVVKLTAEVAALNQSITEEERGLILTEGVPEAATRKLKRLQVARNRAIAELERVKSEYERQVAEWRQGLK